MMSADVQEYRNLMFSSSTSALLITTTMLLSCARRSKQPKNELQAAATVNSSPPKVLIEKEDKQEEIDEMEELKSPPHEAPGQSVTSETTKTPIAPDPQPGDLKKADNQDDHSNDTDLESCSNWLVSHKDDVNPKIGADKPANGGSQHLGIDDTQQEQSSAASSAGRNGKSRGYGKTDAPPIATGKKSIMPQVRVAATQRDSVKEVDVKSVSVTEKKLKGETRDENKKPKSEAQNEDPSQKNSGYL